MPIPGIGFANVAQGVAALGNLGVSIANAVTENKRAEKRLSAELRQMELLDTQIATQTKAIAEQIKRDNALFLAQKYGQYYQQIAAHIPHFMAIFNVQQKQLEAVFSAYNAFNVLIEKTIGNDFLNELEKKQINFTLNYAQRLIESMQSFVPGHETQLIAPQAVLQKLANSNPQNETQFNQVQQETRRELTLIADDAATLANTMLRINAPTNNETQMRAVQLGLYIENEGNLQKNNPVDFTQPKQYPKAPKKNVKQKQYTYEDWKNAKKNLLENLKITPKNTLQNLQQNLQNLRHALAENHNRRAHEEGKMQHAQNKYKGRDWRKHGQGHYNEAQKHRDFHTNEINRKNREIQSLQTQIQQIQKTQQLEALYETIKHDVFKDTYPVPQNTADFNDPQLNTERLDTSDRANPKLEAFVETLQRIVQPINQRIKTHIKSFLDYSQGIPHATPFYNDDNALKRMLRAMLVTPQKDVGNAQDVATFLDTLQQQTQYTKLLYAFKSIPQLLKKAHEKKQIHHIGFLFQFLIDKPLQQEPLVLYVTPEAQNQQALKTNLKTLVQNAYDDLKKNFLKLLNTSLQQKHNVTENNTPNDFLTEYYQLLGEAGQNDAIQNPVALFNTQQHDYAQEYAAYLQKIQSLFITPDEFPDTIQQNLDNLPDITQNIYQENLHVIIPTILHNEQKKRFTLTQLQPFLQQIQQILLQNAQQDFLQNILKIEGGKLRFTQHLQSDESHVHTLTQQINDGFITLQNIQSPAFVFHNNSIKAKINTTLYPPDVLLKAYYKHLFPNTPPEQENKHTIAPGTHIEKTEKNITTIPALVPEHNNTPVIPPVQKTNNNTIFTYALIAAVALIIIKK